MVVSDCTSDSRNAIMDKVAEVLREPRSTDTDIELAMDRAGVNRDEVNSTCGSTHGLLLEMVSELSRSLIEPLEAKATDRTVRDVLVEFGNRLAETYSVSHLDSLYRIVLTEATRHSGIGKDFFERGPGMLRMRLAQYLESSARRFGRLRIDNPKRVADNFLTLLGNNLEISYASTNARSSSIHDPPEAVTEAVEVLSHSMVMEKSGIQAVRGKPFRQPKVGMEANSG